PESAQSASSAANGLFRHLRPFLGPVLTMTNSVSSPSKTSRKPHAFPCCNTPGRLPASGDSAVCSDRRHSKTRNISECGRDLRLGERQSWRQAAHFHNAPPRSTRQGSGHLFCWLAELRFRGIS